MPITLCGAYPFATIEKMLSVILLQTTILCVLNDGSYLHTAAGTYSVIDLSVCSRSIFMFLSS